MVSLKYLLFILSFVLFFNSNAQNNKEFFVQIPNSIHVPSISHTIDGKKISSSKIGNRELDNLINSYQIYSVEKVFKSSQRQSLQNMYLVRCNDLELMNKLYDNYKQFYPKVEDATVEMLILPNDYGTNGGHIEVQDELDYIRAPEAWDITTSNSDIIIGISDNSVQPAHEDLNGKVNVVFGTNYPSSDNQHGSQVSSVAAANTNNGLGMSAIGYNSIIYNATNNWVPGVDILSTMPGVKVINTAWVSSAGEDAYNEIVEDRGVVVVASAGNGMHPGATQFVKPAAFKNVISVSGIAHSNDSWTDAWGSYVTTIADHHKITFNGEDFVFQHNDSVDIVAPSYGVLVADPENGMNAYIRSYGTSYASPIVSGTIALMFSVNYCIDPKEVETILKLTAVKIDHLPQNLPYYGKLGAGKLDAYTAVKMSKDMADEFGTVEVKDRILYRSWFYKLETAPYEIKMSNNDVSGGSKLKFKARNNIEILSGNYYPDDGYIDLSIDESLALDCQSPSSSSRVSNKENTKKIQETNLKSKGVLIFPNPTTGILNITNKEEDLESISISDFTGKVVFYTENVKNDRLTIDMSMFSSGLYIVKVVLNKGEIISKKIIKN